MNLEGFLCLAIARGSKPDGDTLEGIAANCNTYHTVKNGDNCDTVASNFHITRSDFLKWNPAVSDDCTENFWINYAYCVGVDETQSETPTTAKITASTIGNTLSQISTTAPVSETMRRSSTLSAPSTFITSTRPIVHSSTEAGQYSTRHPVTSWNLTRPTGTDSWPPKKTQVGQPRNCNDWHKVITGETCKSITSTFGPSDMDLKKFLEWNPALQKDCSGLYYGWYVCVGIRTSGNWSAGGGLTPTIPTRVEYTRTTNSVDFGWTPSPTHPGQPDDCAAWYQAKKGETCTRLTDPGIVSEQHFFKWNPVLKSKCDAMVTTHSDNPANRCAVWTNGRLWQWYQADEDETCKDISDQFGTFSPEDFIKWNPSVGPDCSKGPVEDLWYCVAVPGTPTTRTPYTPGPTTPPGTGTSTESFKTTHSVNTMTNSTASSIRTSTNRQPSQTKTSRGQNFSVSKTTEHSTTFAPTSTNVISHGPKSTTSITRKPSASTGRTTVVTEVITITTEVPCPTTTEPGTPSCICNEEGISTAYVTQVVTITTIVPCETEVEEPTQPPAGDWHSHTDTPARTVPVTEGGIGHIATATSHHDSPTLPPGHGCLPQPIDAPWPHQPDISKDCRRFYLVHHNDDCKRIAEGAGIEFFIQ